MRKSFHLMAKPTSYQCNIACDYCFYLEKGDGTLKADIPARHMSELVLKAYVKQYIESSASPTVEFTWQGGEPTLAGIDFYRRALHWQRTFADGKNIENSFQTNGVLIDENWALFLAENDFLVGISLDGPENLHDVYRKSRSGGSVYSKVIKAIDLLRRHKVQFSILTVINDVTAQHPLEIYEFLTKEIGARHLQFIPAVEQRETGEKFGELIFPQSLANRYVTDWSVSGEGYGHFITTVFSQWVRHDVGRVYVQLFDNALLAWLGQRPQMCVMQSTCGSNLVVEQNGDVYSCDHYVYPQNRLGNVTIDNLSRIAAGKQQRQFGMSKASLTDECMRCEWKFACQGGCPKHRITKKDHHWHNHLCAGYKAIFSHLNPYMKHMAGLINCKKSPAGVMEVAAFIAAEEIRRTKFAPK